MLAKTEEKRKAVNLRQLGFSCNEILARVPVAKSSLSLWLKDINLGADQTHRLKEMRRLAQLKGAEVRHKQRLDKLALIRTETFSEFENFGERELFLLGVALYWAEGSKQKPHNVSQCVGFSNSNPFMVKLFLLWLKRVCAISDDRLIYDLYIHESGNIEAAKKFWSARIGIEPEKLRVYLKKNKITRRYNTGDSYVGLVKVLVKKSTDLNRRIDGWIESIYNSKYCGIV